jgi:hypothetical protein
VCGGQAISGSRNITRFKDAWKRRSARMEREAIRDRPLSGRTARCAVAHGFCCKIVMLPAGPEHAAAAENLNRVNASFGFFLL